MAILQYTYRIRVEANVGPSGFSSYWRKRPDHYDGTLKTTAKKTKTIYWFLLSLSLVSARNLEVAPHIDMHTWFTYHSPIIWSIVSYWYETADDSQLFPRTNRSLFPYCIPPWLLHEASRWPQEPLQNITQQGNRIELEFRNGWQKRWRSALCQDTESRSV